MCLYRFISYDYKSVPYGESEWDLYCGCALCRAQAAVYSESQRFCTEWHTPYFQQQYATFVTWPRHFTCLIQCVTFEKYDCFTLSFHVLFKMSDHIHKIALELKGQVERIALWDAALLIFGSLYRVFIMQKYASMLLWTQLEWCRRVWSDCVEFSEHQHADILLL